MKRSILFIVLISYHLLSGQILCIKCYDQNDSISSGVNNLIKNGSFENTSCAPGWSQNSFCPNSSLYSCDIKDWKCTNGGTATYASIFDSTYSIIPEGTKAVYFGNSLASACSNKFNDTSCLKDISCTIKGIPNGYPLNGSDYGGLLGVSLEQTVTGLNVGSNYVLEFWVGGEAPFRYSGIFALDLGFANIFLKCNPTREHTNDKGTVYIVEFKAISSTHTIKFTNWGHICAYCTELVLDNVRLYTLAELSPSVTPCTVTNNLNEDISIELYPNPLSNELIVKSNSLEQKELILFDITSRKLMQKGFTNSVSLNTVNLGSGIYFYEIRNKNGMIKNGKILKN